jgi:predicted metal-dependent hydrolase
MDDFYRALVLWDNELFFETHEVLEGLWKESGGRARLILQALIRAAGYYIHLETGNQAGAEKMAARALEVLARYREEIPPFPGLDNLLQCLAQRAVRPPKLL